ncbi:MAG TPA: hypothetical protein VN375_20895 [Vicinamibacteria bacterium]|nr:hypothetical protein [Vicinamibacteria bacterium]
MAVMLAGTAPLAVGAGSLTVSGGGGSTQSSPNSPVGKYEDATLSGLLDLSTTIDLNFSITDTHDNRVPPTQGTKFGTSASNIWNLSAGLGWSSGDHASFGIAANLSPKSSSSFDTPIMVGSLSDDGRLGARSGTYGFSIAADYDTAGESDFESAPSLNVAYTHISTDQALEDLISGKRVENLAKIRVACQGSRSLSCTHLRPLLAAQNADLDQLAVSASYTATLYHNSTVLLSGTYYNYFGEDPNTIGLFSVALLGRTTPKVKTPSAKARKGGSVAETFDFGGGIPLAPLTWDSRIGLSQKLGDFSIGVVLEYGNYVNDTGHTESIAGKLSYAFGERWKASATLGSSRDVDSAGVVTPGSSFSMSLRYRF